MWLRVLVCLLVAAPSFQELKIHENPFDELSYGKFVDIARIEDQEGEVCTNENKCNKKDGTCISMEETCSGESYIGKKWCANSQTCQCCVKPDCHSKTNTACSALNGTCIGINDVCNGQVATHNVFCKNPSTCKCCFPKEISECEVPSITTEATTTTYENKDCQSRTNTACYALNGTCIGINDVCNGREATHKVFCKKSSTCKCCFPKELSECEPYTCGLPNSKDKHDCSDSRTKIVGGNTTFTTSNDINLIGTTLGIRFLPEPGPHYVYIRVAAPGYTDGLLTIRIREYCYDSGDCEWYFMLKHRAGWGGKKLECLPKNEWILLTFRTDFYRNIRAVLQVRGEYLYSLLIQKMPPNNTVTITADSGNTNKYSEISLDCNDNEISAMTTEATTPHVIKDKYDCSDSQTNLVGGKNTFTTSNDINLIGTTLGIRFLPGPGNHYVYIRVEAPGYTDGFLTIQINEVCYNSEDCKWFFTRWHSGGTRLDYLPKNEWILLTFSTDFYRNLRAVLQVRGEFIYSLLIPVMPPNNTVSITFDSGSTNKYSEISLDCNANSFLQ